ncbi:MAG TPA: sigma-54 dependent transcriptional regulator [Burkholderiaceae bacterium]|nr:sigma-54 dependent transcriptional regulator [Burkholderiaceae bacterium]
MPHVLILESDKASREALAALARDHGCSVAVADGVKNALLQFDMRKPDLLLADVRLPDEEGMGVCREALGAGSDVVIMADRQDTDNAVAALRLGVKDYLRKPVCFRRLGAILKRLAARKPSVPTDPDAPSPGHFSCLFGESEAMQVVYRQIARVAPSDMTVFVLGESGTGKELVAHAIHDRSARRDACFLAVNCGAISATLIESEMFGHERGSFTGADRQHKGFFERAHRGTLFLDEITEMSMDLQVKLLRVLETGCFMRIGGHQERISDVRVIAATNRCPEKAVKEGRLREDLYYRLAVFPLELPALRSRGDDVLLLANLFLDELNAEAGTQHCFADEALERLRRHDWPGNVRELRNTVQRAYIMADDGKLKASFLSAVPRGRPSRKAPSRAVFGEGSLVDADFHS